MGPQLALGDGALGFWKALRQVYPGAREQRCWVHKTGNVLNKLPKGLQKKGDYIPESQFPLAPHSKPCYKGVTI